MSLKKFMSHYFFNKRSFSSQVLIFVLLMFFKYYYYENLIFPLLEDKKLLLPKSTKCRNTYPKQPTESSRQAKGTDLNNPFQVKTLTFFRLPTSSTKMTEISSFVLFSHYSLDRTFTELFFIHVSII
jgi:hypothetical protein